jgi:3-oxoacyl-[acyl-carrier protein] reductase
MSLKPCVIITGASKGLGFALVQEFLKSSTLIVIACARTHPKSIKMLEQQYSKRLLYFTADITHTNAITLILDNIKLLRLKPQIVINNAAALLQKSFLKTELHDITQLFTVNVFAPIILIQALIAQHSKTAPLHIINIASMGGIQGSMKFSGLSIYASTKAALIGLTECIAEEFKNYNVRCNAIALGATQTEMFSKAFPDFKAPVKPLQVAQWICMFALAPAVINGKIIPLAVSTP